MTSQAKTPRNDGGMSHMTTNSNNLNNSLSSRPIAYNRFQGGLGTG